MAPGFVNKVSFSLGLLEFHPLAHPAAADARPRPSRVQLDYTRASRITFAKNFSHLYHQATSISTARLVRSTASRSRNVNPRMMTRTLLALSPCTRPSTFLAELTAPRAFRRRG